MQNFYKILFKKKLRRWTKIGLFFLVLPCFAATETASPVLVLKAPKPSSSLISNSSKINISQQDIQLSGTTTLAQSLQNLGGVQLQNITGNMSQAAISMRGFGSNASSNTLILLNGIPLTNPDLAPPDLNIIPLHEIETIEIIAGSESVLYGDQAVAGVVNLITHQTKKKNISFVCNTGSNHQFDCYIVVNHYFRNLFYDLSIAKNHTDNYRDHNQYDQTLLFGQTTFAYSTGKVNFNFKAANETMQFPGALTAEQVRQNRRQASNDSDYFKNNNYFLHIQNQQQFGNHTRLITDLSFRDMHGHGVLSSPFSQSRSVWFFKPQFKTTIKDNLLVSGLDIEEDHYHLGSSTVPNRNNQQKYGLFALLTIPLDLRWSLAMGARGAQQNSHLSSVINNNTINHAWVTHLGATFQYTPQIQFYLRRAGSFRFPKADENAAASNGIGTLRTQRGLSYETGMQWDHPPYSTKIGLYELQLDDEISFDPTQTPQQPFGSNRNLSPTTREGMTLSAKDALTKKLSLNGQLNYVHAVFQNGINAGNRIPLVSETIIRTGLNYYFTEPVNIYSEAVFTGNQYAANDDANIAGKLGGYTIFNLNLRYRIKHMEASIRLNNIFNKYYYFYTVYIPSSQSEFFYPAPGRNIVLTIKWLWD